MSHFSVIVIGDDIEGQLAPYQENNMGDCPKEYLEFNDVEDEYKPDWDNNKSVDAIMLEGNLYAAYSAEARKAYPQGVPDDVKIKAGVKEIYGNYDNYMSLWAGYKKNEETGKYGYWENPNRKWDWYVMGGRWTGYFKLKPGAEGKVGESGAFGPPPPEKGWVDQARKGDIDIKAMREAEAKKAAETFDKFEPAFKNTGFPVWKDILAKHGVGKDNGGDIAAARAEYHNHPTIKALSALDTWITFRTDELSDYFCNGNRAQFIENAVRGAISSYAVVKDGKWYQKGEMGWFGMASDEKAQEQWDEEFARLINDLPEDTMLTVIDCHI